MTKLTVFGCSHSDAARNLPTPWPVRLCDRLGWDLENYAESGFSNDLIFRNTMKYLAMGETPDHLVVQWTELKRYSVAKRDMMTVYWETTSFNIKNNVWANDRLRRNERHPHFLPEQEMILTWTWCIQEECKRRGIDCSFVAYCDLGGVDDSPLWNVIEKSRFLHSTFKNGWMNHVSWLFKKEALIPHPEKGSEEEKDFDRRAAGGHLTDKSVEYTTDCWYNYYTDNKQVVIEDDEFIKYIRGSALVYRYN